MKKRFLVIAALIGLLAACRNPAEGSPDNPNNPVNPVNPNQKTVIVFDNTQGICTAVVYNDDQRRDEDKIVEIPAGARSQEFEWTPGTSVVFYFTYRVNLKGISGFTLSYVPAIGKDRTVVPIGANTKTNVVIPKLDETLSSPNALLSNSSYLLIQNNSSYSFQLLRGDGIVQPDNFSNSLVTSGGRAQYTINAGAASPYRLLEIGGGYIPFPSSLISFEAGCVYSFVFNNGVLSLISEVEMKLENVAGVSANIPETPGVPAVTAFDSLLTVRWTAVEGAESYEVYIGTEQEPPAAPERTVYSTTTVFSNLTNKTPYYVWVKAVNENGASDFSPRARGIPWPVNEAPAVPGMPVIIEGVNQLTVNWEECGGASSYEVYFSTTTTPPSLVTVATDKTSAVINNLVNDVIYYIWVRAVNSAGKSGYSPIVSGTPKIPTVAPAAPARPVLVAGNKELAVSWQAVELAAAYEVWYGTSDNSAQAEKFGGDISGGITETIVTGLTNETMYHVWIKAKNIVGESGFSLPASARPSAFAVLPETPALPTVISGNRELVVSWTPVEGALFYEVWNGATNNSANAVKHGADVSGTSMTLTGLNNGTTYYIWIKAKNNIGTSDFSQRASGTPSASAATPPDPQAAPTVTAGSGQLAVSWQAVEGASAYEIWAGTTINPTAATKRGNDVSSTSATITGLNNGTTYYVWIKAKNSVGTSGFSPTASGTPSASTVTPQSPSAPAMSIGNGQITVSWTAVEGAMAYEIWTGTTNNSASAAKNGNDESDSLSRTISGLTNGTTYYVWIKAKNGVGTSGFSPAASGKPIGNATVPTLISSNGQLSVTWAAIAGADQYEVFYGTGVNPPQTASQTVTVTTATITGLTNGIIYNVWIRGKNSTGNGAMGGAASTKPIGNMGAVSLVSGNGQLSLSWNSVAGADEYEVYHNTSNSIPASAAQTVTTTTATISGLTNGTTYYVWVKGRNTTGTGSASAVVNGRPLGIPGAPIVSPAHKQLLVTWAAVLGADEYEVYYGTGTTPTTLATTTAETSASITGLTNGTTYYVRLRAKNTNGISNYGTTASNVPSVTPGLYRGAEKIGTQNLSASFSWISANVQTGDEYYIVLGADESVSPMTLEYSSKTVGITLLGYDGEKTITLATNGSIFTVYGDVTLTVDENITLVGRYINNESLISLRNRSNLIINEGAKISGNTISNSGSGITISGGTVTMNGGTISENTTFSGSGGGIYIYDGTVIINGGTISGNRSSMGSGGGIYVNNGTVTMNGGTISENIVREYGGGIYVDGGGTFTMNDGTINENTSTYRSGGGIYVRSGTITMNGGTIRENSVCGIILDGSTSTLTMYGGIISGNGNDGGISVFLGTVTMHGGTISENTGTNGGGIYVGADGTVNMNSGTISGNTGTFGGGIHVNADGTVTMNGGTINGNTGTLYGGGVYVYGDGTVTMNGGIISGNTGNIGGGVYIVATVSGVTGTFKKLSPAGGGQNSGIIYGSDAVGNDANGVPLRNASDTSGHAVYNSGSPARWRNTTAGQTDQIDTTTGRGLSTNGNPPYGQ